MAKSLRPMMFYAILPRFAKIGFKYAQPFLISRTITFASSATDADNVGWALIGAFGLVFGGLAVSTSVYKYICVRHGPSLANPHANGVRPRYASRLVSAERWSL